MTFIMNYRIDCHVRKRAKLLFNKCITPLNSENLYLILILTSHII